MMQQPQTIKIQLKHLDKLIIIHQPPEKKHCPTFVEMLINLTPPPKKNTNTMHF